MPKPMEDEPEICQDGDKGRLWLTLLNEASRQGVPSLSACLDLAQCDMITARDDHRKGMNEEILCAGEKKKKKKRDTNFLCLTTVEFVPIHSLNTARSVSLTYSLSLSLCDSRIP